jgi:hypothetical protein
MKNSIIQYVRNSMYEFAKANAAVRKLQAAYRAFTRRRT